VALSKSGSQEQLDRKGSDQVIVFWRSDEGPIVLASRAEADAEVLAENRPELEEESPCALRSLEEARAKAWGSSSAGWSHGTSITPPPPIAWDSRGGLRESSWAGVFQAVRGLGLGSI
jgi:hypothetical protein